MVWWDCLAEANQVTLTLCWGSGSVTNQEEKMKVTYSLWAIGCGQMPAWPKIVMSLTSYWWWSCDDIQQWAKQQCHSQAVSQDDMWWDCKTEKSSTLIGCVGHKMWCDKNACQWQRLHPATWLTRCFLRPWDETVWRKKLWIHSHPMGQWEFLAGKNVLPLTACWSWDMM